MPLHESPPTARFTLLPQPWTTSFVFFTWLLLVNSLHPGDILIAALVGWAVPWFSRALVPVAPRVRSMSALLSFLPVFLYDLMVANLSVALLTVSVWRTPKPAWLVVPLDTTNPFAITTLAAVISLTPGTVSSSLTADRRSLLVHALHCTDPASDIATMKSRYEAPIRRIFEG